MKTFIKLLIITLFFSSCNENFQFKNTKKIKGNNNIVTKTISTSNYDIIKVKGAIDVHLVKGNEGEIVILTDENIQEYIEIVVQNDALEIKVKKGFNLSCSNGIDITVPFEDVSEVILAGSGDIDSKDVLDSEIFKAQLSGSGDIDLNLEAKKVYIEINGSGDVVCTGETNDIIIDLSGSGSFKGSSLIAKNADIEIAGSGDVLINSKKRLRVSIVGSGSVKYMGKPKIDTEIIGSGNVSMK